MARAPSTPIQASAARISSAIAGGIELSRSGRLSVIVATWSATSSLIVSKLGMSVMGKYPLAGDFTFTFTERCDGFRAEIGRASWWERGCQYGWISVGAVTLTKKEKNNNKR